ncbi:phosphatidic acid phosphatase [Actinoplanes ianthinogenes]|uniref:Phosphatidic acid phosphatase n=1 Tax=Actinoplanes ianthinogenes TaxID=122358 RepID=A0ABN6CL89_9ACTN|nr:phosphatase PAP2 family protein [Actinoplanes ianthinogenes]BCJ45726.1 phosphatidic acid phosphatase [Actinoplanes ianthinogenes]GGR32381.1 phosphatidic acid phosphatase [Actinoplanes ianthinogenes]
MKKYRFYLASMGAAFGLYALLTALIAVHFFIDTDIAVRDGIARDLPHWLISASKAAARLGQGGPLMYLSLVIAAAQSFRLKTVKHFALWACTSASLIMIVGSVKMYTRRGAPADPQPGAVEFFSKEPCGGPACQSFPSGHVANSVVWYGLILILLNHWASSQARRTILASAVSVTAVANVVSGHHWLSDSLGGMLAGSGILGFLLIADRANPRIWGWLDKRIFTSRRSGTTRPFREIGGMRPERSSGSPRGWQSPAQRTAPAGPH